MSKIEVDTIAPQSGTTVTLGEAGDTVNIPSGVTLTNSGTVTGFGTSWQSDIKTASFTAASGEGYFIDTSSSAITMTLPAGSVGDTVEAVDSKSSFSTNSFTIAANGSEKIQGSTENQILVNNNEGIRLVYSGATDGWVVPTSNTIPEPPTLTSVTGNIFAGAASDLTLAGTNFLEENLIVNFLQSSDSINVDVTVTPTSQQAATVTVPSSVFSNVTAGNVVTVKVINSNGQSSNTVDKTSVAAPSGGTITTSGGYRYHTFLSSGTFVNTVSLSADYLAVAGGGSGGASGFGAGGGAGGLLQATVSLTAQSYSIVIGGGGSSNSNGGDTTGLGVTADGGGVGGAHLQNGADGGSGGGGGGDQTTSGGSATPGQGNNGGTGFDPGPSESAGGGGGAGAVGGDGTSTVAGSGGAGLEYSTFATATSTGDSGFYAGGGGGGVGRNDNVGLSTGAPGGSGGGGKGGLSNFNGPAVPANLPVAGDANTGGGGGGGDDNSGTSGPGGANGGSGIFIIRYQL
jgi:hypothetical protein